MICIPIKKKTLPSLLKNIDLANKEADCLELWLDQLKLNEAKLKEIFKACKKPVLYKCENTKNIEKVLIHKPKFIDLDYKTDEKHIQKVKKFKSTKLILSYHNFKETPDLLDLKKIVVEMQKDKADISKLATYAKTVADSFIMMNLLGELTINKIKSICICMGEHGSITRTTGHLLGNYLMYAPLTKNDGTAKGQIPVKELKEIIKKQ